MNKGTISKVKIDDKYHYCIRLENTVRIKDKNGKEREYNVFLFETNNPAPNAKLVPVEDVYTFEKDLTSLLGKKLDFCIDFVTEEDNNKKESATKEKIILKSVEYYET